MANVSNLTSNVSNITKQSMAGVSNLPSNVSSITKQTTANVSHMTKQGMANVSNLPSNVSNITKQRIKLNVKVLGVQLGSPGAAQDGLQPGQTAEERPSYREQFTAPEMSIVSKFMSKVGGVTFVLPQKFYLCFMRPLPQHLAVGWPRIWQDGNWPRSSLLDLVSGVD